MILAAGFPIESDAFKTLVELGWEESLRALVDELLRVAGSVEPRPLFISADLGLRAAEKLELTMGKAAEVETSLGAGRRFAEEHESRLEVAFGPWGDGWRPGGLEDVLR